MIRNLIAQLILLAVTFAFSATALAQDMLPESAHYTGPLPEFARYTGPPIVKDEKSALRIARAMLITNWPNGPWRQDEAAWASHCQATLIDGVWLVRNKGPAAVAGPCTNAMVVGIAAKDGAWRGSVYF